MRFLYHLVNEIARFDRTDIKLALPITIGLFGLAIVQQVFFQDSVAMCWVLGLALIGSVVFVSAVVLGRAWRATNQTPLDLTGRRR